MGKLLQRALPFSLFVALAAIIVSHAGCAYEYDASGKLYPPDSACGDVATCFQAGASSLTTCLDAVVAGDSYAADVWSCVGATKCLHGDTTSAQFQGFLQGCYSDASLAHPYDALFLTLDTLNACLVGSKAEQALLIDVCATE